MTFSSFFVHIKIDNSINFPFLKRLSAKKMEFQKILTNSLLMLNHVNKIQKQQQQQQRQHIPCTYCTFDTQTIFKFIYL